MLPLTNSQLLLPLPLLLPPGEETTHLPVLVPHSLLLLLPLPTLLPRPPDSPAPAAAVPTPARCCFCFSAALSAPTSELAAPTTSSAADTCEFEVASACVAVHGATPAVLSGVPPNWPIATPGGATSHLLLVPPFDLVLVSLLWHSLLPLTSQPQVSYAAPSVRIPCTTLIVQLLTCLLLLLPLAVPRLSILLLHYCCFVQVP